jgi:transcriptional regulator GlxA family with amidase domain
MPPLRSRTSAAARYGIRPPSNGSIPAAPIGAHGNGANDYSANGRNTRSELGVPISSRPFAVISAQESRIRKILQLIESDPAHSVHELAAQFNLSDSHLQHLFKQQTGVQLGHLLLEHRLLKATQLLENSNMSVKEIAFAVGYEHTSSFIRAFERRFATAPRSYRQQYDRRKC